MSLDLLYSCAHAVCTLTANSQIASNCCEQFKILVIVNNEFYQNESENCCFTCLMLKV